RRCEGLPSQIASSKWQCRATNIPTCAYRRLRSSPGAETAACVWPVSSGSSIRRALAHNDSKRARAAVSVKSCAYISRANGSGAMSCAPKFRPSSATSWSPPSANGDRIVSGACGKSCRNCTNNSRTQARMASTSRAARLRWLVTPTTSGARAAFAAEVFVCSESTMSIATARSWLPVTSVARHPLRDCRSSLPLPAFCRNSCFAISLWAKRGAADLPATTALFHDRIVADCRIDNAQLSIRTLDHQVELEFGRLGVGIEQRKLHGAAPGSECAPRERRVPERVATAAATARHLVEADPDRTVGVSITFAGRYGELEKHLGSDDDRIVDPALADRAVAGVGQLDICAGGAAA